MMKELGAGVIGSDALGHQEINTPDVKRTLVEWWGKAVIAADGSVDRGRVASIVFGDESQRRRLEALLHPRIARRHDEMMAEFDKQDDVKFIVIDSPLLFEAKLDRLCDAVVFVEAPLDAREERSEKYRRWPRGTLARREKNQQPLDMKRRRADYICDNNSTLNELRKQVEEIVTTILSAFRAA